MPFVTRLTFQSGDQKVLERAVQDIKQKAAHKGVEFRGPNPEPLEEIRVPQYKRLSPDGGEFEPWHYTVYTRTLAIVGYDEFARKIAGDEYPPSIHVTAEVKQVQGSGR